MTALDPAEDLQGPNVLYLVGRVDRIVRSAITEVVKRHGLSTPQYTALSVLARRSGLSNAQLARRSLVSSQSMNELLLALEHQGLVRRRAHPAHGRIRPAQLTPKGRKVLAACDVEVNEVEAAMLSGLTREEKATLRHSLVACVHALNGDRTPT